jgi:hypothetical protein
MAGSISEVTDSNFQFGADPKKRLEAELEPALVA